MKTNLLIALISVFAVAGITGCKKDNKNDTKPEPGLDNIIKRETYITFYFEGKARPESSLWETQEYNDNGTLKYESLPRGNNPLTSVGNYDYFYKYEDNKLVEKIRKFLTKEWREVYTYESGLLKTTFLYVEGDLSEHHDNFYDESKQLIKTSNYSHYMTERHVSDSYYFYENGRLAYMDEMEYSGEPDARWTYKYDSRGNILKVLWKRLDTNVEGVFQEYSYKYDASGRIAEFIKSGTGGAEYFKTENIYYNNGLLKSADMFKGNSITGPFQKIAHLDYKYTHK